MAYGGGEENIEMNNMNDYDQENEDNDDDENSALINDQTQSTSTHRGGGARPKTRKTTYSFNNPSYVIDDDIPEVDKRPSTMAEREEKRDEAWDRIKRKFPNINIKKSEFTARMDEFNHVKVILNRERSIEHYFFDSDGELNSDLPKTFKKFLGLPAEKIVEKNDKDIDRLKVKNREDIEEMKRSDISELEREQRLSLINLRNERIADITGENERIQNRMLLRDRIKAIFKKHGFTIIAVISAVGAIIGVIISNLKTGLAKLASGVGNGFKDIGKKLGAILPGMIGAIASFIFKTAGEVVGFLAKNAWLLIIAVVIFFVDQFKSRASTKSFKKKNK